MKLSQLTYSLVVIMLFDGAVLRESGMIAQWSPYWPLLMLLGGYIGMALFAIGVWLYVRITGGY